MNTLSSKHCRPCEGGVPAMSAQEIKKSLQQLGNGWQLTTDNKKLFKDFRFKNYYQTMAFVNAIAWMAHTENHHPDLEVGYNRCLVKYSTHAIDGLSENDFICALKVEELGQPFLECALK